MTISEALAWQGLWIFVFAFVVASTALAFWQYPSDRSRNRAKHNWANALIALSMLLLFTSLGMWNATLWINFNTINS